jgi:hypothetical protein
MTQPKLRWPAWVLILDIIGTLLVGLGIYSQVANGPLPFAEFLDLRALAVPIIILGALMVTPLVFMTISQLRLAGKNGS